MDLQELRRLKPDLRQYLKKFDRCIRSRPNRDTPRAYIAGQLGPLERKSIEPIALAANIKPRTMTAPPLARVWLRNHDSLPDARWPAGSRVSQRPVSGDWKRFQA